MKFEKEEISIGKYWFLYLLLVIFVFGLAFIVYFKIPKWVFKIGGLHDLAIIFGVAVIFYSIQIRKEFGKILGDAFIYIIFGISFLTVIHVFHILAYTYKILDAVAIGLSSIEHLLYYLALASFVYGFHRMLKSIKK